MPAAARNLSFRSGLALKHEGHQLDDNQTDTRANPVRSRDAGHVSNSHDHRMKDRKTRSPKPARPVAIAVERCLGRGVTSIIAISPKAYDNGPDKPARSVTER